MKLTIILVIFCTALFAAISPGSFNQKCGLNLFGGNSIWRESASDVQSRMHIRLQEDGGKNAKRYSGYFGPGFRIFSSTPSQIVIYEEHDRVTQIDIIMANKGDYAKKIPGKKLEKNIEAEAKKIKKTITNIFGEPFNGSLKATGQKKKVQWWHWNGSAIIFDEEPGEYIIIRFMKDDDFLNQDSKSDAKKKVQRQNLKKNVMKNKNGDVFIDNIPMVNQGDKGYCGPATLERVFRYYRIEGVDMHRIASDADASGITGTNISRLNETAKKWGHRVGLDVSTMPIKYDSIMQAINSGVPLIWTMYSTDEFNLRANLNTIERQKGTATRQHLNAIRKYKPLKSERNNPHVCLIIGYNERYEEIAVSDSWGKGAAIRWVRFKDLQPVSMNNTLILFR